MKPILHLKIFLYLYYILFDSYYNRYSIFEKDSFGLFSTKKN